MLTLGFIKENRIAMMMYATKLKTKNQYQIHLDTIKKNAAPIVINISYLTKFKALECKVRIFCYVSLYFLLSSNKAATVPSRWRRRIKSFSKLAFKRPNLCVSCISDALLSNYLHVLVSSADTAESISLETPSGFLTLSLTLFVRSGRATHAPHG